MVPPEGRNPPKTKVAKVVGKADLRHGPKTREVLRPWASAPPRKKGGEGGGREGKVKGGRPPSRW